MDMISLLMLLSLMASRSYASLAPTHHTISVMRDYNKSPSIILSQIYNIRGGGDGDDSSSSPYEPSYNYAAPQQQQQQQHQQPPPQLDSTAGSPRTESLTSSSASEYTNPSYEYRETVEDRIDAWRKQQQVCSCNR